MDNDGLGAPQVDAGGSAWRAFCVRFVSDGRAARASS
jgi:hypothetical protein